MFFIFLHISVLSVIVHSTLRTDCYVSLSNPEIYIKISHYYPSGPIYLYGLFSDLIESNILGRRREIGFTNLHFKRFDDKCTPSILFSTPGPDFNQLRILIILRLNASGENFAWFEYTFFKGFKHGIYQMFDQYQNFLLHAQIQDVEENYLKVLERLNALDPSYVKSINEKNSELCVITTNNHAVILKPNYDDITSHGFITLLRVDLYRNENFIDFVIYPAFECNKNETYSEDALLLITDENNIQLYFSVIDIQNLERKFKLSNTKIYNVEMLKHIPNGYKKLFLIKYDNDFITCPDRSKLILYVSKSNITYYVTVFKPIYISTWVEFYGALSHSPFNICGLKNEKK